MSKMARSALWVVVVLAVVMAGATLLLRGQGARFSISPEIDLTGEGPPWTNERTGEQAGPDYVGARVPFEHDGGCGSENYAMSISYLKGWYVQSWDGPHSMVSGRYLADTELPKSALFTDWSRPDERLWVVPTQMVREGEWDFLFVERHDHVERWPRATFGCA